MDENMKNNCVELRGTLADAPEFSHESRGERFYRFPLEVARLSGTVDRLNIIARQEMLASLDTLEREKLCLRGELRSFNNKSGVGSRLVISVFAREMGFADGEDMNLVRLTGTLCKTPNIRVTPMGREICDLMLAVNRRYGRSDYLPCIAWGLLAREAAEWAVGDKLALSGRLQSRRYIKLGESGEQQEKTAFEVSISEAERL